MNKLSRGFQLLRNMGWKYFFFRIQYEVRRKSGLLKKLYPVVLPDAVFLSLADWRKNAVPFFFSDKEKLNMKEPEIASLSEKVKRMAEGEFCFFSSEWYRLEKEYDWVTNPDTGYKYDVTKHWTQVEDIVEEAGDIKYVWEKSRFSFLYDLIRHEQHTGEAHAAFVFFQILDWIHKNPLNCGPNYKCSQEISLRVLNWVFALYYYRNAAELTDDIFNPVIRSIYGQMKHVRTNIHFSRIAVRNNHAITETLALYIVGLLFPQFPEAAEWKRKGKKWFEEEIEYQIAGDGTYLQFSMNYHRVVVQVLTWAIALSDRNNERFSDVVYERAYQALNFLYQCQDEITGWLPNYGANDGALFFKLNDAHYRDCRPQLDALHYLLTGKGLYENCSGFEDRSWYLPDLKVCSERKLFAPLKRANGPVSFSVGGYYLIRENDCLTFIRCGKYRDRPGHADNLHIDIWYKGENLLMDGGSYKYNTDFGSQKYFSGTESHNTVMIGSYDQMKKGARFIWFNWSQALEALLEETEEYYGFSGKVSCFTYLNKQIVHSRKIRKFKGRPQWEVEDEITPVLPDCPIRQIWHTDSKRVEFSNEELVPFFTDGWYSSFYGGKEKNTQIEFVSENYRIRTVISVKEFCL